ncbi:MAG: cell division protein FtsQ/DivIB [Alphaproteobacteria bacterium]|nr:cell division protein FtsQ/DivIB [Alphaproteobacteria bacterium]
MRRVKEIEDERPQPKRRRAPPAWWRPVRRWGPAALALAALGGGAGWIAATGGFGLFKEDAGRTMLEASARSGLAVREVFVEGRVRTPAGELLAAVAVDRGAPILAVDLNAVRQRVERLSWVRRAVVERHLPDTVLVSIVEREPVARWQIGGRFVLVDAEGATIPVEVSPFAALPLVVGDDAPAHAAALVAMLAEEPELARRVKAAVRVSGRRWNLVLDRLEGGIDVRLPEENADAAWRRLARYSREENLLDRRLTMIDLRVPDRLVIGTTPTEPVKPVNERRRGAAPGKDA